MGEASLWHLHNNQNRLLQGMTIFWQFWVLNETLLSVTPWEVSKKLKLLFKNNKAIKHWLEDEYKPYWISYIEHFT